jgi:hypothetical protein
MYEYGRKNDIRIMANQRNFKGGRDLLKCTINILLHHPQSILITLYEWCKLSANGRVVVKV